ncbi:Rhodanese-like domain-containing protein [Elsinoe ampelina]|uniref:Rhodanese-like domain-containing protein n=1 Tax=Elsinoe ampelina TaxID=302913 RepID=A0A6A6FYR9_9PEZI|nr:Rhodanese-like domain-containing protein [Elsinoe ampelina]
MPQLSSRSILPQWRYPSAHSSITREALLRILKYEDAPAQTHLLIDVRRTDHEGGTIHSSLNLPAQTFYHSRSTLARLCVAAKVTVVVFYCGSSRGRGPRCAGWFADYLVDHGIEGVQSVVLEGGVKGWVRAGREYIELMDGFEGGKWAEGGQE